MNRPDAEPDPNGVLIDIFGDPLPSDRDADLDPESWARRENMEDYERL